MTTEPTNVTDYLLRLLSEYKTRTGANPTRIYLGTKQYDALKALATQHGFSLSRSVDNRPEWNGLQMFCVDSDSHVGFGWDGPSPCG